MKARGRRQRCRRPCLPMFAGRCEARAHAYGPNRLISPLRMAGLTTSMRHRPAAAVPIDERFVARRLAMAEGVLSQTLERFDDESLSRASATYATLEVERAAARVRYWRGLQRRESTHPSMR